MRLARSAAGVDWDGHKRDLAADRFDNGRSPEQLRDSYTAPGVLLCLAWDADDLVGTARALSDGVCNAWLIDVWTRTSHRRRGLATATVRDLLARLPGQHVALFTDDAVAFYAGLGFEVERKGMSQVVGRWLAADPDGVR